MNELAAPGRPRSSRIRSITILVVLVVASLSGAVAAEFTAQQAMPAGGDPSVGIPPAAEPLAFDSR